MTSNDSENSENTKIDHVSHFTRTVIDLKELDKILKEGCNHGLCGGVNLGNTCFMNSSIACLSNCTELTTFFLTGKYKEFINKKNKLGLGGKLANAWYKLLEEYWNSNSRVGNPSNIKSAVAKKVKKFSSFNQQDSNEFMTEFLSILNEDLNKTDKKIYKELKEKEKNEDELACADRFWNSTDEEGGLEKPTTIFDNCGFKVDLPELEILANGSNYIIPSEVFQSFP